MRYLFLLYGDESAEAALSQDERMRIVGEHEAFAERMRTAGRYVAGAGLEPSATATVVRRGETDNLVTDGPYTESKEQIGGLYLIECADLDDALAVAAGIPASPSLVVEVRPAPY